MTAQFSQQDRIAPGRPRPRAPRFVRMRAAGAGFIGILITSGVLMATAPAAAASEASTTCSPPKLVSSATAGSRQSRVAVLRVNVRGLSCAKAVSVAREVASDLAAGRAITLPGTTGLDLVSTTSCASCAPRTEVSIDYPGGAVTLSIRGASGVASAQIPTTPGFPFPITPTIPLPANPFSPSPPASRPTFV